MSSYYRIFCETDEKWEYVFSVSEPTECPTDSNHTVNPNSVSLKKAKYDEDFTLNLKLSKNAYSTDAYTEILSFLYQGCIRVGKLRRIEITYNMTKNGKYKTGSSGFGFMLRIYDITNNQTVYETSEVSAKEIIHSGEIDVPDCICSQDPASWSIEIKKGSNGGVIKIRHIRLIFFSG